MFKADQKSHVHLHQEQKKQQLRNIDPMEQELMVIDDDCLMSSAFRICSECGQNHSLSNNFEDIRTSIDVFSELLQAKNNLKGSLN